MAEHDQRLLDEAMESKDWSYVETLIEKAISEMARNRLRQMVKFFYKNEEYSAGLL